VFDCAQCQRTYSKRNDICHREGHTLTARKATKHCMSCASCGQRKMGMRSAAVTAVPCPKCGKRRWQPAAVKNIRGPTAATTDVPAMTRLQATGGPEIKSLRYS
jgi:predicted RNA-binding Zn-ribbon protein involved in translation (DUF1610 family)